MHIEMKTGRIFLGLGIAGIGIIQLLIPGFRPMMAPIPPEPGFMANLPAFFVGLVLLLGGFAILMNRYVRIGSLVQVILFFLCLMFFHLPNRIRNHPEILGMWTDAIKLLAFLGGALILFSISSYMQGAIASRMFLLGMNIGRTFYAIMLVLFGVDHFLYLKFVKTLVPVWMGMAAFWTGIGGVALLGSGIGMLIRIKIQLVGRLLALMLILWLFLLHLPRAFASSTKDHGNEWTSVCQCLAFAGIALLISSNFTPEDHRHQVT